MSSILISVCLLRPSLKKRLLISSNVIKGMLCSMASPLSSEETNPPVSVLSMTICSICASMNLNIDWGKHRSFLKLIKEPEERSTKKSKRNAKKPEELKSPKSRLEKSGDQARSKKLKKISSRLTSDHNII